MSLENEAHILTNQHLKMSGTGCLKFKLIRLKLDSNTLIILEFIKIINYFGVYYNLYFFNNNNSYLLNFELL